MENSKVLWVSNGYKINPRINIISVGQEEISIKPRLMDLLDFFLHHQNQIVTKDELMDHVWKDRIVTDNSLTKSISELRMILDKHFNSTIEIETLRNVGYRFHAPALFVQNKEELGKSKTALKSNKVFLALLTLFSVALIIIVLSRKDHSAKLEINYPKSSIITSLKGTEISPALSPDGKKIAFAWQNPRSDYFGIYVKSIYESVPRKLTESHLSEFNPTWAEDGEKVIFFRNNPAGGYQILEKSIFGKDEIQLAQIDSLTVGRGLISSHDNNLLFFTGKKPGANYAIFSVNTKTQAIRQISFPPADYYGDVFPSLGLNIDEVAFVRLREYQNVLAQTVEKDKQLIALNFRSMKSTTICAFENDVKDLFTDLKNQSFLCWQSNQLGHNFLTAINDKGNQQLLYETSIGVVGESAKVDSMICFEVWNSDLSISKCDISADSEVSDHKSFLESTQWEWGLDIANNNNMAFISNRSGSQQIWYGNVFDPFSVQQYSRFEDVNIQSLDLSSDGKLIIALSVQNNSSSVFLVRSNEALVDEFLIQKSEINSPVFSADNSSVYYTTNASGQWNIWQYEIETGITKELIAYHAYDLVVPHHDPDNIYYITRDQQSVWMYNTVTGQKVKIADSLRLVAQNWFPTDSGIYFLKWKENTSSLVFYEYATGIKKTLKEFNGIISTLPSLTLSPDYKSIFITKSNTLNSDIMSIKV